MKFNFIFKIGDEQMGGAIPKGQYHLMTARDGNLNWIRTRADAERFLTLAPETGRTHVAKTN
jgi:hypothetical protein